MPSIQACRRIQVLGLVAALLLSWTTNTHAKRPAAPDLLPENTLAIVRILDTQQLVQKFRQTGFGRLTQDEQIKPLLGQLYGAAGEAFQQVEEQVGLSLSELLALPQGEITIALVAPDTGQPALVVLLDVGKGLPNAEKLLASAQKAIKASGTALKQEDHRDTKLNIFDTPGERGQTVVQFVKDETICVVSNMSVAKDILDAWDKVEPIGEEKPPRRLSANRKFNLIMKRCQGSQKERPELIGYVDPIELARVATRGNFAAQTGIALLPVLGLDGLEAVGASIIFPDEQLDDITHFHVMLDNPRSGIMEMLAVKAGDTTPPKWVPGDVASYSTIHWDVAKTYKTLNTLYDSFRGDDALAMEVQRRISEQIAVDFEEDILNALDGRFTLIRRIDRPAQIGSLGSMLGAGLKDSKKFALTLKTIMAKFPERLEKKAFNGVEYYQLSRRQREGDVDPERARRRAARPRPCLAIVSDSLLIADRPSLLEKAIATSRTSDSLAEQLDYKLITRKIRSHLGSKKPGAISFDRPEEGMKMLYELATGEQTRQQLTDGAENVEVLKVLDSALNDNPLPPFKVIAQYLAPRGGMLTNDETGFHYTIFTLKRKKQ
jgi:hypothetical protein